MEWLIRLPELVQPLYPFLRWLWFGSGVVFVVLSGVAGAMWIGLALTVPIPTTRSTPSIPSKPTQVVVSREIGGGVSISSSGPIEIVVPGVGSLPAERFVARDISGATVEIDFILLYRHAIWAFGSHTTFLRGSDIEQFLMAPDFAARLASYSDVLCLGLTSNASESSVEKVQIALSRDRAIRLCRMVREAVDRPQLRTSALGLGYNTDPAKKNSWPERMQRSAVLVGARPKSGDPDVEAVVSRLLCSGSVGEFDFRQYSLVKNCDELPFETIQRKSVKFPSPAEPPS